MAYGNAQDIGSLRFLGANVIYQATGKLLASGDGEDRGVLDDAVLMLDVVSSYYTEGDEVFAREMAAIQKQRQDALSKLKPGFELDPAVTEKFRWAELKAMFRSLCRKGTFVRLEAPESEWTPNLVAR